MDYWSFSIKKNTQLWNVESTQKCTHMLLETLQEGAIILVGDLDHQFRFYEGNPKGKYASRAFWL